MYDTKLIRNQSKPREKGAHITTIVSSQMAYAIAAEYGLTVIEV